eukprot:5131788-Amphidinium_carterae.1
MQKLLISIYSLGILESSCSMEWTHRIEKAQLAFCQAPARALSTSQERQPSLASLQWQVKQYDSARIVA